VGTNANAFENAEALPDTNAEVACECLTGLAVTFPAARRMTAAGRNKRFIVNFFAVKKYNLLKTLIRFYRCRRVYFGKPD
jgi:hypothetical protein